MKVETLVLGRVLKKEDDDVFIEFDERLCNGRWVPTDFTSKDFTGDRETIFKLNLFFNSDHDYYLGEDDGGDQWLLRVKRE